MERIKILKGQRKESGSYGKAGGSKRKVVFYKIALFRNVKYFPKHRKIKIKIDTRSSN